MWKSTDAGATMVRDWPTKNTQAIGAIAVASDGTLYAGGGEAGPGGGSITYGGQGVYRSTDGGAHWTKAGNMPSPTVGRIVVDPTDPNRVFVAGTGDLFNPGGGRGVYRTTDGGAHWKRVLKGTNGTTGAVDLAMDPSEPERAVRGDVGPHPQAGRADLRRRGLGRVPLDRRRRHWKRLENGLPPRRRRHRPDRPGA